MAGAIRPFSFYRLVLKDDSAARISFTITAVGRMVSTFRGGSATSFQVEERHG
jgi:hypothetical protein